jgi:hypothetical protein
VETKGEVTGSVGSHGTTAFTSTWLFWVLCAAKKAINIEVQILVIEKVN